MFELGAPVMSVLMDHCEQTLYAGDVNGNVYAIDLHYQVSLHGTSNTLSCQYFN